MKNLDLSKIQLTEKQMAQVMAIIGVKSQATKAEPKKAAKAEPKKAAKAETSNPVQLVDYSEKSYAIIGDTKPIKDKLKGKAAFCRFLTIDGEKVPGWVISKKTPQAEIFELIK